MRWILLFVALLLSGCADVTPADDDPGLDSEPEPAPKEETSPTQPSPSTTINATADGAPTTLSVVLDLEETQLATPFGRNGLGGSNCAGFDVDRVIAGNLTATWTPNNPAMTQIELGFFGEETSQTVTGSSPLVMDLQPDQRDEFFEVVHVMVQAPRPGVLVQQDVQVEVNLVFEGGSGDHEMGSCSFS